MSEDPLAAALAGDEGAWAREHLERDIVGWLTTVAPDGTPQASVISFLHEAGSILFYSRPGTLKMRNLERSRRVSFHLQSDPYGDHGLTLEGTATVEPDVAPSDVHPAYSAKYREPLAHWNMDEGQTARDFSVAIRIRPERVRAF